MSPLYDYYCHNSDCGIELFEVLTTFKESTERCPKCGAHSKDRKKFYQYSFNESFFADAN